MKKFLIFIVCSFCGAELFSQGFDPALFEEYNAKYRPHYHYTPEKRGVGDPSGLIKINGKYIGYGWGATKSEDLVHWTDINDHAIKQLPKNVSSWTGSVVIDRNNTAGFGEDAMVAIFTGNNNVTKKQSQDIAFSHDNGETFLYYDANPVLDIWSTEFRDPTVFFYPPTEKWIMAVARAAALQVAFYESSDLKHWEWLSDFGPAGDIWRTWECPDMFQLPVDGDRDNLKWVLVVSVNGISEQYFIGDFDGEKFIPDTPESYPLYVDSGLDYYASRIFRDYDDESSKVFTLGWVGSWDYARHRIGLRGKGFWSIPREYSLKSTPEGLRLFQLPVESLKKLRNDKFEFNKSIKTGKTSFPQITDMDNSYELEVEFDVNGRAPFGFSLCEGNGKEVIISYNPNSHYVTLDRTNSSDLTIPKFEKSSICKINPEGDKIKFDIFVDKSSIEIFINDGEGVMTALTYAGENQTGMSLFTLNPKTQVNLKAWKLNSIYN